MISFLRYWLPLMIWMVVIFGASADTRSSERTSRILEPFMRWLKPDITSESIDAVRLVVRKAAHVAEFAVLGWLLWRALYRPKQHDSRPWSYRAAAAALGIAILYAAADEFHQSFVPNRTGSVKDVCIDTAGAVLGLICVRLCYRSRTE